MMRKQSWSLQTSKTPPSISRGHAVDDIRQRELTADLNRFYDEVVSSMRDAEEILILGPGEAKGELKKRLAKENLSERIVGIDTAGKMTDPQIVAEVKFASTFLTKVRRRV